MNQEREEFIDYAKGILIVTVTLGHFIQFVTYRNDMYWNDPVFKFIYMFHMPLFMAISGYVAFFSIEKVNFFTLLKRRAISLLLPIASWSLVYCTIVGVGIKKLSLDAFPTYFFGYFFNNIWFLWALFASTLIVMLVKHISHASIILFLAFFIIILLVPDQGILPLFKYTFPFFYIGYVLRKNIESKIIKNLAMNNLLFLLSLITTIIIFLNWDRQTYVYISKMDLSGDNLPRIVIRWLAALTTSIVVMKLMHLAYHLRLGMFFTKLGKASIYIYLLQSYFFLVIAKVHFSENNNSPLSLIAGVIFSFILSFLLLHLGKVIEKQAIIAKLFFGRTVRAAS